MRPRDAEPLGSSFLSLFLCVSASILWFSLPALAQQITCSAIECQAVLHGTGPACTRLRIHARGPVTLHAGSSKTLAYTLKIVLSARSPEEARRQLEAAPVRIESHGPWTVLTTPAGDMVSVVSVEAPRLEAAEIAATMGSVHAGGVAGTLDVRTGAGNIEIGQIGGALHCVTGAGSITLDRSGGETTLQTNLGDIEARQAGGSVQAQTGGGDIHIGSAAGPVIATTGGGEIAIGKAAGPVTVRNLAGPIQVGSAAGIHCESASGGIRLDNIAGPIRVATSMGSILANLAGGRLANSYLATGFGDITVLIPSNLGVTIQAEDDMADTLGRIRSDFAAIQPRRQGTRIVAEGAINGGGPLLQISGMGGTIFIKRQ